MKKILGILFMLCVLIISLSTIVQADSVNFDIVSDKTKLKPGDEVLLTFKISSIDIQGDGINAIEAKLDYDRILFENVKQSDVKGLNGWSVIYNSENTEYNGKLLAMILSAGVNEPQEIFTVKLKVKKEATSSTLTKQVNLNILNIQTNDGNKTITDTDKSIPITIQFDKITPSAFAEPVTINNSNVVSNNGQTGTESEDKTIAEGNVPQTGTNELIIIGAFVFLVGCGSITYIRYKNIILK